MCAARSVWTPGTFIEKRRRGFVSAVGSRARHLRIVGGVDSRLRRRSFTRRSAISSRASSSTRLLRLHERDQVERRSARTRHRSRHRSRRGSIPRRLAGVEDPEKKRTIIGHTFIDVFEARGREGG
jgi:GMP synthase (glutamine-hydrolysing)